MSQQPLTGEQLHREVKAASIYFAVEWHKQECLDSSEERRLSWAARHWQKFTDLALDFLALREVLAEKEAAEKERQGFLAPPPAVNPGAGPAASS